jgi:hypothetical protein
MTRMVRFSCAAIAMTAALDTTNAQENLDQVTFIPHFIRISEGGGFLDKTWTQLNTPEFKAGVGLTCAALGCAPLTAAIIANAGNIPITSGGNYATSGHIVKQDGEAWYISFPPPAGYTTCSAAYDGKTISANKGDTSNAVLWRRPAGDWVGTYNVVPKHRPEGHWVKVDFVVKYVKKGTEDAHHCAPDNAWVWKVP